MKTSEEIYKNGLRRYAKTFSLEDLRDKYLDTVRLINEVLKEEEIENESK